MWLFHHGKSVSNSKTHTGYFSHEFLNTWMFVCVFSISTNSYFACFPFYMCLALSVAVVSSNYQSVYDYRSTFLSFSSRPLCYASFPLIQQPSLFFSRPSQVWVTSQRPSFYSGETFGHSPMARVFSAHPPEMQPVWLGCPLEWRVFPWAP